MLAAMAAPTVARAIERLEAFPLFAAAQYGELYPDVAVTGLGAGEHFLRFGAFEGRQVARREHIARILGECIAAEEAHANSAAAVPTPGLTGAEIERLVSRSPPIGIYASSRGNLFMNEIAEDVAADLRSIGAAVSLHDEESAMEERAPICLFVSPEEFFLAGRGREWIREDVVATSFMFGVDQIQTNWFARCLPLYLMSRGVIDICYQAANLLRRSLLPSRYFTPGPRLGAAALAPEDYSHPLFLVLPAAAKAAPDPRTPFDERPLDIMFSGMLTPHRSKFFARHAAFLSSYETFIHCVPNQGPYTSKGGTVIRLASHVPGHAKITLNIHEEEFPYFEWQRIVQRGMCAGSVVVSEPCLPHPDFKPGVHYLEERARHIPNLLEWLLRTEEGRLAAERVRENANALIFDESRRRQNAARLLEFLIEHRAIPEDADDVLSSRQRSYDELNPIRNPL
jgi:hypothetical protein